VTDTRKLEEQTPENKSKVTGELTDSELNQVSGGTPAEDAQKAADEKEQAAALNNFNKLISSL
jgi:bacteriocin-like protein